MTNPDTPRAGYDRRGFLRLGLGGLAVLGTGPLLAACGGDSSASVDTSAFDAAEEKLYDAASKEDGLTLYTSTEESIVQNLAKAVQDRYGIKLEYQRLNSGDLSQRYAAEQQAKTVKADVVLTGDPTLAQAWSKEGWLAKVDATDIPQLSSWPQEYAADTYALVTINPYSMAINTTLVDDAPTDWDFLTSDDAKLVTVDLNNVGPVALPGWLVLRQQYGDDFLEKVGANKPVLADSGPSCTQQLASGAAAVYFPCSLTNAAALTSQGAPIKAILPTSGPVTGVESPAFISADAPHPASAKLFFNYLLTDAGQKILNVVASSPSGVSGTPALPANYVRPDLTTAAAQQSQIADLLGM